MKAYSATIANNILVSAFGETYSNNRLELLEIPDKIPAILAIYTGSKRKSDNYSNGIVIV